MGDLNNKNKNATVSSLEMEQEDKFKKYKKECIAAYVTNDQAKIASIEQNKQNLLKKHEKSDLRLMSEYSFGSYKESLVVPKKEVQKCFELNKDMRSVISMQNNLESDEDKIKIKIQSLEEEIGVELTSYTSEKNNMDNKLNRLNAIPVLIKEKTDEIDKIKASPFRRFLSYFTGEIGALEKEKRSLENEQKLIKGKLESDLSSLYGKGYSLSGEVDSENIKKKWINKITKEYSDLNMNEQFSMVKKGFIDLNNRVSASLFPYVAPLLGELARSIYTTEKNFLETQQRFENIKNHRPQVLNAELHEYQNKVQAEMKRNDEQKTNGPRELYTLIEGVTQPQSQPGKQQSQPEKQQRSTPEHDSRN
ncbi:hypothetical protein V1268_001074 [Enterococcus hirae]|uniref:hypothetical protein n=1 Tax=Enterococcus TaxID=1350 RepID=UPI00159A8238|nr:hypothetical protein [Enterococcus hirae]EMF0260797.1 hypothetical protein [Enterococcus hirae]MDU1933020.1 hypothetical protein [Enterococcus hirae]QKX71837.1 hypothetical protein HU257_09480 [Enterococcus hirae]